MTKIRIYELQTAIAARRSVLQSSHDFVPGPLVLRMLVAAAASPLLETTTATTTCGRKEQKHMANRTCPQCAYIYIILYSILLYYIILYAQYTYVHMHVLTIYSTSNGINQVIDHL